MTCAEAREYMSVFIPLIEAPSTDRHLVIAPPFTAISTMSEATNGTSIALSSQNVHWEDNGAYTAEISPLMLLEHNVQFSIV